MSVPPGRGDIWRIDAGVLVISSTVSNEIVGEPTVVVVDRDLGLELRKRYDCRRCAIASTFSRPFP